MKFYNAYINQYLKLFNKASLNASLRKITKTRRIFPTDDSVIKLLYLALHNISAKWTLPIRDWKPAMSQFMLMYGERISG
ncbi:transposase [Symbiopectobacterium purcellii]|uniref:transposase n=1 Tax=Symbiopectobacterium purcellii TaxID=2871826 RepID=UPI003F851BA3